MGSQEYRSFLGKHVDLRLATLPDAPVVGRMIDETPTLVFLQSENLSVLMFTKSRILTIKEVNKK